MTSSIDEFETYYWPAVCLDCHTVSSLIKTGFSFDTVMSMHIPDNFGLKPCPNCGSTNRRTYGATVTFSNEGLKVENSSVDSKLMSAVSNIFSGYEKATGQTIIHLRHLQEIRKANPHLTLFEFTEAVSKSNKGKLIWPTMALLVWFFQEPTEDMRDLIWSKAYEHAEEYVNRQPDSDELKLLKEFLEDR